MNNTQITNTGTGSDKVLRQVRLSHIDTKLCNSTSIYNGTLADSMMCAGDLKGGADTCYVRIQIIVV